MGKAKIYLAILILLIPQVLIAIPSANYGLNITHDMLMGDTSSSIIRPLIDAAAKEISEQPDCNGFDTMKLFSTAAIQAIICEMKDGNTRDEGAQIVSNRWKQSIRQDYLDRLKFMVFASHYTWGEVQDIVESEDDLFLYQLYILKHFVDSGNMSQQKVKDLRQLLEDMIGPIKTQVKKGDDLPPSSVKIKENNIKIKT